MDPEKFFESQLAKPLSSSDTAQTASFNSEETQGTRIGPYMKKGPKCAFMMESSNVGYVGFVGFTKGDFEGWADSSDTAQTAAFTSEETQGNRRGTLFDKSGRRRNSKRAPIITEGVVVTCLKTLQPRIEDVAVTLQSRVESRVLSNCLKLWGRAVEHGKCQRLCQKYPVDSDHSSDEERLDRYYAGTRPGDLANAAVQHFQKTGNLFGPANAF